MNKGKIVQVMGPVVDVAFEDGNLPHIQDALTVMNNGKRCVMEVCPKAGSRLGSFMRMSKVVTVSPPTSSFLDT